jgi:hypothetical protein
MAEARQVRWQNDAFDRRIRAKNHAMLGSLFVVIWAGKFRLKIESFLRHIL